MSLQSTKSLIRNALTKSVATYRGRRSPSGRALLDRFAKAHRDVTFLQIGAHDGKTDDHLHELVMRYKWRGVLVEPVRYLFDRLVANYDGNENLAFVNKAIADRPGTRPFYRLRENNDGLPNWYDQLGSFNKDVVLKHAHSIPDIEKYLIVEQVQCTTPAALLREQNISKVDLVLIDTEGFDYEVLKVFDFDAYRPSLIVYEWKHLSEDDVRASRELLARAGYRLTDIENGNCVGVYQPLLASAERLASPAIERCTAVLKHEVQRWLTA